jgi:hypothetical protein
MSDQEIHNRILEAINNLNASMLDILERDVNVTFNVFEMESEFIKTAGLPDEAIQYDVQCGRGLVRINVEWTLHHLWQEGAIKKVGPNTYQSLKGDKAPYKSTIVSSGIKRYTKARGEVAASVKILKSINMAEDKIFESLRGAKAFQDIPSIVIYQAIKMANQSLSTT